MLAASCSWSGRARAGPSSAASLILDPLAVATRLGVLVLTLLTLGVARGAAARRHPAEYVAVMLFAATGLTLMAAAQQLLLAFLALELASLSLYVLAGFDRTRPESAEAALKYFLFGGMAAAFLLFGFSLIYGLTGSIELPRIAAQISAQGANPLARGRARDGPGGLRLQGRGRARSTCGRPMSTRARRPRPPR